MTTTTVGTTILRQLGGARFVAMTGAKHLLASETPDGLGWLSFRIPMRTKDGSNFVRITLTAMDDYIMEFLFVRGTSVKPKSYREGVYNDTLCSVFTSVTGLETSLGTMARTF